MTDTRQAQDLDRELNEAALRYHAEPVPGKISVTVTKPTAPQRDLSLAYTPGVAEPVRRIYANPADAYRYTAKGNLVAVITDGTAVHGLGNVGPLAGKPVMEGKAVLFKHFAGIDVFDIEVDAESPEAFIETVVRIAPTFGGINLEDIAAPHCFGGRFRRNADVDRGPFLNKGKRHSGAILSLLFIKGKVKPVCSTPTWDWQRAGMPWAYSSRASTSASSRSRRPG